VDHREVGARRVRVVIIGAAGYRLTSNDGNHDAALIDTDSRLFIYRLDAAQRFLLEGGLTKSACHGVNYTVVGSADRVSITMQTPDGTEQSASEHLPCGRSVGCIGDDELVAIAARNLGDTGDLTCEIRRGGKLVAQAESSGPYVLACCND
jgi:hypothetical protein